MSSPNLPLESDRANKERGIKGEATVFEDAGRLKINLPRQYFGGKQVKKALGMQASAENKARAERIAKRITLDLQDGCFDETLIKYGVKSNIKLLPGSDNQPPTPKLGTLEIWQQYLEYRKPNLKETTFYTYNRKYTSAIEKSLKAVGDDPINIRFWLLSNRSLIVAARILSQLSFSYQLAIKQKLICHNPFQGMSEDLPKLHKTKKVNLYDQNTEDDKNLYDPRELKKKAFTTEEVKNILDAIKKTKGRHYYPLMHFLFLSGVRTNEATSLMWGDIKWDNEYIVIQRSYSPELKKFVLTKTGHFRLFPLPKNGELWNLLKSMTPGLPGDLVFKGKTGKIVNSRSLGYFWRGYECEKSNCPGLITALVSQGKVSKYLPLYNTRHTFISYQINECGIPPHVVKDWCGHSERVTTETYRQGNLLVKPVGYNDKLEFKESSKPSRIEVLEQQVQLLIEQNKMLQEIIVNLETSKSCNTQPITDE